MSDTLFQKLETLHRENQPDPAFADALDSRLRAAHVVPRLRRRSLVRPLAAAAALLLIAPALVLTIPPLRTLAQEMFDLFVVGTMPAPTGTPVKSNAIEVETIEEAEAIAGFDALQVLDSRFPLDGIGTNTGYVNLFYKTDDGLLLLSQWIDGAGPAEYPIPPEVAVQSVTINGIPAQYVSGAWGYNYAENSQEWGWQPDVLGTLSWRQGNVSFILNLHPADTAETLIAIAEALQ